MFGFDNLTLLVISGLAHAVLAVMLVFFRKPASQLQVIRLYAISHIFLAIGLILVSGRRGGSIFWTSTIPNTLVTLGMTFLSLTLARFFRWQIERPLIAIGIVFALTQLFIRNAGFTEHIRLAIVVIIASSGQFVITWIYARRTSSSSLLTRFLAASNFIISLLFIWRIVEAGFADVNYDFFNASYGQFFGLLALFLNALVNGFGFLLLLNEYSSTELLRMASQDPLTLTANRHQIMTQAQKELAQADRHDSSLVIALIDIQNLGAINQQFNFYVGDETIKSVVVELRKALRGGDSIGRWTGKEFLLLLPQSDSQTVQPRMQHFQTQCLQLPVGKQATAINTTIAIGITPYHRHEDFQLTLHRVEDALQQARKSNDQKVVVVD